MDILYNNKPIINSEFLKVNETQIKPEIKINKDKNKIYLLIMYDPDAVGGTHIHWILSNIINNDANNGLDLITYKGPAPPPNSGKHHYIFELYEQKLSNQELPQLEDRIIPIEFLRNKLKVDKPLNKIQFISQNDIGGKKKRKTKRKKSKHIIHKNKKTNRKHQK
jgi:phosphatidylethanolamine-binding protein (PEBP) family uncharacterized protein